MEGNVMKALRKNETDQRRNLNPHKSARMAIYIYGARYAKQLGGSMDFWDSLSEYEKKMCRLLVEDIEKSPEEPK